MSHGLVAAIAAQDDLRVLSVKGPVAVAQGLRGPERTSIDADILVHPEDHPELVRSLVDRGWSPRQSSTAPSLHPRHADTLTHPVWPTELDVHRLFPGFLAEPGVVFDALYRCSASLALAGQELRVPPPSAHALLLALNIMRDEADPVASQDFIQLVERSSALLDTFERKRLADLLRETKAASDAIVFVTALGLDIESRDLPSPDGAVPELVHGWVRRAGARQTRGTAWLFALADASWAGRIRVLRDAAWPDRREMERRAGAPLSGWQLAQARLKRLWRGRRLIAGALADFRARR